MPLLVFVDCMTIRTAQPTLGRVGLFTQQQSLGGVHALRNPVPSLRRQFSSGVLPGKNRGSPAKSSVDDGSESELSMAAGASDGSLLGGAAVAPFSIDWAEKVGIRGKLAFDVVGQPLACTPRTISGVRCGRRHRWAQPDRRPKSTE